MLILDTIFQRHNVISNSLCFFGILRNSVFRMEHLRVDYDISQTVTLGQVNFILHLRLQRRTEYKNQDWLTECNQPERVEDRRGTWGQKPTKSKHKRAHLTPPPLPPPPPLDILTHLTLNPDYVIGLLMGPGGDERISYDLLRTECGA